jgi:hypothetical protein
MQVQIVNEMKRTNATRTQVNSHLTQRVDTLRHLFSTKEVCRVYNTVLPILVATAHSSHAAASSVGSGAIAICCTNQLDSCKEL